jgi:hypothetical protein
MSRWLLAASLAVASFGCRRGSGSSASGAATPSARATATPESGSAASLETSPDWTAPSVKPRYAVSGLETPTRPAGYASRNESAAAAAPAPTWDPSEPSAEQQRRQSKGY